MGLWKLKTTTKSAKQHGEGTMMVNGVCLQRTHPDSSDQLRRSHITQVQLLLPQGESRWETVWVLCSYCNVQQCMLIRATPTCSSHSGTVLYVGVEEKESKTLLFSPTPV